MFRSAWKRLSIPISSLLVCVPVGSTTSAQVPLTAELVVSGLLEPLFVAAPAGDTARLFIAEQHDVGTGRIRVLDLASGTLAPANYLTIYPVAGGGEQGLLGMAFDPQFATNGFVYVYYTEAAGDVVIARYEAETPYMTSPTVNPSSAFQIARFVQPSDFHTGGWMAFGPDGYLYVARGDGDQSDAAQMTTGPLLGKILRLDVRGDDFPADATRNYAIPPTNPFVGTTGEDEIYHYGLRNPWRNSFDRVTGQLYIADVGDGSIEEVSVARAGQGGLNFGWRCMEGNSCTGFTGCACDSPLLNDPIATYGHAGGNCSIIGGYAYRGSALCGWQGRYFFADFCSGRVNWLLYQGSPNPTVNDVTALLDPPGPASINNPSSFGEDANGELYICDRSGELFKLVPAGVGNDCNLNGTNDTCDIQDGTSTDVNANGLPDECEYSVTPYCFGNGTALACPCGNAGAAGNGCAHSLGPNGANLSWGGVPSISADTFTLRGTSMPNGSALFFQGTTQLNGGAGGILGDGLRCAGGAIRRLGTKMNSGGTSQYPAAGDLPISVRGGLTGPQTRTYQVWYRNAATFCTPSTFNLTNGLAVVWTN